VDDQHHAEAGFLQTLPKRRYGCHKPVRMLELTQRFGLDLADAQLARH
jgi:hypothetical protein